jgi:hypothetical protein
MAHSLFLEHTQPENFIALAVNLKRFARAERILGCGRHYAIVPFWCGAEPQL